MSSQIQQQKFLTPSGVQERVQLFSTHGGRLATAKKIYPNAPQPWLDLSTGINPWRYIAVDNNSIGDGMDYGALPDPQDIATLQTAARKVYGAEAAVSCVAVPGSELALRLLPRLVSGGRTVAILGPTYASHGQAWAQTGHSVKEVSSVADLKRADVGIVVNPNNPDGRTLFRSELIDLAKNFDERDGMMIVDEAFCDCCPENSVVPDLANHPSLVVLRSFGKFFGLAGLRLGFILTRHPLALALHSTIGDWPISNAALAMGQCAIEDLAWQQTMRERLSQQVAALDEALEKARLSVLGGTSLFRLVTHAKAPVIFDQLASAGVLVRPFSYEPTWLRLGLPGDVENLNRLSHALSKIDT